VRTIASARSVVCFGEVLWDLLPDGRRLLGGAPANVAYHLQRLGVEATLLSRVGRDEAGGQAREELERAGVATGDVQIDAALPTGSASISSTLGEVCYDFATPAAWDAIEPTDAGRLRALVFGTLAQRDCRSRATLRTLVDRAPERIYDLNLRPPYTPIATVTESLGCATLVKMNEDEAELLAAHLRISSDPVPFAREIMERFGPRIVCVTRGGRGAWLADSRGLWIESPGIPVRVCDPIGAGDAFLAALVAGLLASEDWRRTLQRASELGAWVASRPGAMPPWPHG
jgi:fructokinase